MLKQNNVEAKGRDMRKQEIEEIRRDFTTLQTVVYTPKVDSVSKVKLSR